MSHVHPVTRGQTFVKGTAPLGDPAVQFVIRGFSCLNVCLCVVLFLLLFHGYISHHPGPRNLFFGLFLNATKRFKFIAMNCRISVLYFGWEGGKFSFFSLLTSIISR